MPKSQKPIICINGSRSITNVNLGLFINPNHVGCVVTGGARGIDTLAEHWAKANKIEWVCYLPQWDLLGKRAGMIRNKEMVDFCDILISFWDGKSSGTKQAIEYAQSIGRPYICHLIEDLD